MDSAQMMGGIYAWVDLTGFRADDDDTNRAYSGRGLQIGADMEVMPDMVVGLSLGVEDLNATVGAVNQDGVLRYLQPYLAYSAPARGRGGDAALRAWRLHPDLGRRHRRGRDAAGRDHLQRRL
jgi:hypothetical protein